MPQLEVTPEAVKWIRVFMEMERRDPKDSGFRLGVRGGGCSGMQYMMGITAPKETDHVFASEGIRVLVDPKSMPLLEGARLHFLMKYQGAGFVVMNPQVAGACGCGTSFAIKGEAGAAAGEATAATAAAEALPIGVAPSGAPHAEGEHSHASPCSQ
ncbi:MAG: iron-sulfur cluster assembly accessory protein [Planctomycetes bacterium]|nr:iron-sulfur cluster assembly accessory protein [Planctomycetota bacterium]